MAWLSEFYLKHPAAETMEYSVFRHLNGAGLSGVAFKDQNSKKKVISHLSAKGESTIPELAELLNISVPKTKELLTSLLNEGLVKDSGRKTEGIGRRATIYSLDPESCYFLGIEIKKYKINIGLMSFNAELIDSSMDIPFTFSDGNESLDAIIEELQGFLTNIPVPKEKILGLGLSLAGRINVKTSKILSIYHFGNAPVKEKLEEAFHLPVYIDNDSRTLAYGEYHFGKSGLPYREKNVCIVNLDYGIAVGIFANGGPIYGASGYAGEIGHIPMFNNEKICFCGKKGCLETEASGLALIDFLTAKIKKGSSSRLQKVLAKKGIIELEDILEAVRFGDNLAIEGVAEIAYNLGKGLAVIINLLNPELIVLGGMLSGFGELLLLPVKTSIMQHSLSLVNSDTRVTLSTVNQKAALPGCCLLVRNKILGLI
ncbi:MAG: ROK family transcriptional regulator [Bacteroidota bacterium]|nr:ROK family transcriptional regulator [Bacteroidota bacterium]MDP4212818.1 ROK family transcriptional regulator [Bacteroidota bacterium]MDP4249014.1 ROK family transcriptional regulator [Bacteroidota bacterium]